MPENPDPSKTPTPYREPEDGLTSETPDGEEPSSWWRDRLEQRIGGRPLILYLVIVAGVGALLLLLVIIIVSATKDDDSKQSTCLDIAPHDAVSEIFAGNVDKATITIDNEQSELGPVAIKLEFKDNGGCRALPQGVDNRDGMLQILGAIEYANSINGQKVRTEYDREDVPVELLSTATPTPAPTGTATVEGGAAPTVDPNAPTVDPNAPTPTSTALAELVTPTPSS
jgi:hypothetical protein